MINILYFVEIKQIDRNFITWTLDFICFNIFQIFGINSEGQKDERIISAFGMQLKKLYEKSLKFPLIVIATSETSDLPVELERLFVETTSLEYLQRNQRLSTLSWLLKNKGIMYQADLNKLAGLCSDFVLADLDVLILNARKMKYRVIAQSNKLLPVVLLDDDFIKAYGENSSFMYIQYTTIRNNYQKC